MEIEIFITRLVVAFLAGSIIGFERQWHHKSAGLRTNTLVTIGSAIYVLLSIEMTTQGGDVTRIVGQVVVGVGFLGGGVILHQGLDTLGLTTAATIWCSSAIGCLAGGGYLAEVAVCTVVVVFVNGVYWRVDDWLKNRKPK